MRTFKMKIISLFSLLVFVFFIFSMNISAAEIYSDTSYYSEDMKWSKMDVDYWVVREEYLFGKIDKTNCYIKIYDENGNPIDNIHRLAAQFKIGNETFTIEKNSVNKRYFTFGNLLSKEGQFSPRNTSADYEYDKTLQKQFSNPSSENEEAYTGHANYLWKWHYYVTGIEYMYCWYDDENGEEVAASFYENGEHPVYDEDGNLLGIYDKEDNLIDNNYLDEHGQIIEIDPESGKESDLLDEYEQKRGDISIGGLINADIFNADILENDLLSNVKVISMIILLIILLVSIFPIIESISNRIARKVGKNKYKKKRKYRK